MLGSGNKRNEVVPTAVRCEQSGDPVPPVVGDGDGVLRPSVEMPSFVCTLDEQHRHPPGHQIQGHAKDLPFPVYDHRCSFMALRFIPVPNVRIEMDDALTYSHGFWLKVRISSVLANQAVQRTEYLRFLNEILSAAFTDIPDIRTRNSLDFARNLREGFRCDIVFGMTSREQSECDRFKMTFWTLGGGHIDCECTSWVREDWPERIMVRYNVLGNLHPAPPISMQFVPKGLAAEVFSQDDYTVLLHKLRACKWQDGFEWSTITPTRGCERFGNTFRNVKVWADVTVEVVMLTFAVDDIPAQLVSRKESASEKSQNLTMVVQLAGQITRTIIVDRTLLCYPPGRGSKQTVRFRHGGNRLGCNLVEMVWRVEKSSIDLDSADFTGGKALYIQTRARDLNFMCTKDQAEDIVSTLHLGLVRCLGNGPFPYQQTQICLGDTLVRYLAFPRTQGHLLLDYTEDFLGVALTIATGSIEPLQLKTELYEGDDGGIVWKFISVDGQLGGSFQFDDAGYPVLVLTAGQKLHVSGSAAKSLAPIRLVETGRGSEGSSRSKACRTDDENDTEKEKDSEEEEGNESLEDAEDEGAEDEFGDDVADEDDSEVEGDDDGDYAGNDDGGDHNNADPKVSCH